MTGRARITLLAFFLVAMAVPTEAEEKSFNIYLRPQATGTLSFSCRQGEVADPQVVSVTTVPAAPNAPFTASSNVSWLSISPASGVLNSTGSTTLTATASCYGRAPGNYSGTLSLVSGKANDSIQAMLTVSGGCTYSLSSLTRTFSSNGGSDRFGVSTSASCSWVANSDAGWLRITTGSSGTGNGSVSFSVEANADIRSRQGTISVQDQVFTVSQQGISFVSGYYQIVSRSSGMALDVRNTSTAAGALIQQFPYLGGANQQWQLIQVADGSFIIISRNSGLALDVQNSSKSSGALIQQYTYLGGPNQRWELVSSGGGFYEIVSQDSGLALDVKDGSNSAGAPIQQYSYGGGANQQWQILMVGNVQAPPFSGAYEIMSRNSGLALDVRSGSSSSGALIQQFTYLGSANQQWQLIPAQDGSYAIISRNSGLALDVQGASKSGTTLIQQYTYLGSANQKWQLILLSSGFYEIVSQNSGLAMDVRDASATPGALIQQYSYVGGANQQWRLIPIQ